MSCVSILQLRISGCVVLEVQVREEMEKELEHLLKQKDDQVRMTDSFSTQWF